MRDIKWYGFNRDLPSFKDKLYSEFRVDEVTPLDSLPPLVDLRSKMPQVYDQKALGSCTANAIGAGIQFLHKNLTPSRLFIYYNERAIEGTIDYDCGGQLRDAIKAVATQGVCAETLWPYDISKFATKPLDMCYSYAKNDLVTEYLRVVSLQEMKSCLAAGYPFVFGFTVYESFEGEEVARTGILNLPSSTERTCGGHAVIAVGYNDATQRFIVRNSWGPLWGQQGYFEMGYDYISSPMLSSDFWTIRKEGK